LWGEALKKKLKEQVAGQLEILHDKVDVIVNFPALPTDENGNFWIRFSPDQARHFAKNLNKHADAIEAEDHGAQG